MVQEGGDLCMPSADSHWCAAETNTTLQSNSPPVKTHTHTHTHTPSADSRYYTAESNTTLQSNSPPVKTHTQTQRQLQPLFSWPLQIGPSLSVSLFFFFASSEPPFADLVSPSLRNQVLCLHFSYSFQIPTNLITAALGSPPVPWKLI